MPAFERQSPHYVWDALPNCLYGSTQLSRHPWINLRRPLLHPGSLCLGRGQRLAPGLSLVQLAARRAPRLAFLAIRYLHVTYFGD
jgi:hypothetical protein